MLSSPNPAMGGHHAALFECAVPSGAAACLPACLPQMFMFLTALATGRFQVTLGAGSSGSPFAGGSSSAIDVEPMVTCSSNWGPSRIPPGPNMGLLLLHLAGATISPPLTFGLLPARCCKRAWSQRLLLISAPPQAALSMLCPNPRQRVVSISGKKGGAWRSSSTIVVEHMVMHRGNWRPSHILHGPHRGAFLPPAGVVMCSPLRLPSACSQHGAASDLRVGTIPSSKSSLPHAVPKPRVVWSVVAASKRGEQRNGGSTNRQQKGGTVALCTRGIPDAKTGPV